MDVSLQLTVAPEIASTNLRPHLVLWAPLMKTAYIIELTVAWKNAVEKLCCAEQWRQSISVRDTIPKSSKLKNDAEDL